MAEFVKVARTTDIEPGQARLVEVKGKQIALFNVEGEFCAPTTRVLTAAGLSRRERCRGTKSPARFTAPNSTSAREKCLARRRARRSRATAFVWQGPTSRWKCRSSSTRPANGRLEISNQSLPGQSHGEALDDRCERF